MTDIIFSWKFFLWVAIPILFRIGGNLLERYRPEIFEKYKKRLTIGLAVYFFLAIVLPGMWFLFAPETEKTAAPAAVKEEQAAKEFFKEPPEPKKGQGPGFQPFAK